MGFRIAAAALVAVVTAAPLMAAPVQWAGNGHWYEYVGPSVSWTAAFAASAGASAIAGYTPHLVTITSADENAFVSTSVAAGAGFWFAGTDIESEGTWVWAAGPETGDIFWGPGAPGDAYSNWNAGEPNNAGNEDYGIGNWSATRWNDLPASSSAGYVVEWSRDAGAMVPEPASWAMLIVGFGLVGSAMRRRSVMQA